MRRLGIKGILLEYEVIWGSLSRSEQVKLYWRAPALSAL